MCISCRRPINCYNDKSRYKTIATFYVFDLIIFIIRLGLVSNDISKKNSDTTKFLIPMILLDLIGSLPIIICNIIYIISRHCVEPLVGRERSSKHLWHIATMTCIRFKYHQYRPQSILFMRVLLIISFFLLKFICFIIGATCSAKFKSECTAYTVIAAFGLLFFILIIIVELVHFFRLWNYNPIDTRNFDKDNKVYINNIDEIKLNKTHRRHLGFIHHSLLNDENSDGFGKSICKKEENCHSKSLHHYLFYHSLVTQHKINIDILNKKETESFIAFYRTTKTEALNIAQNGFPYGDKTNQKYKEYLRLKQEIYFTPLFSENSSEATIFVRINLGRFIKVNDINDSIFQQYFARNDGEYDTIYVEKTDRFYLRMPGQIEKWLIAINDKELITDKLDGTFYKHCF